MRWKHTEQEVRLDGRDTKRRKAENQKRSRKCGNKTKMSIVIISNTSSCKLALILRLSQEKDCCWPEPPEAVSESGSSSLDPENPTESCKSRGSHLRVHLKNTRVTAQPVQGTHIPKAPKCLWDATLQSSGSPLML